MRKSKAFQVIIIIGLIVLMGLLNIPKYNQVAPLITEALVSAGFDTLNFKPSAILIIILILETITSLINIAILNWIYKTCSLNYSLTTNSILYLFSSCVSKVISLFIPLSILSTFTLIPNLLFAVAFIAMHYYINNDINFKQKSWIIGFVLANVLISII